MILLPAGSAPPCARILDPKAASSCDRVPEIACSTTNLLTLRTNRVAILGAACTLPRSHLVCVTNQIDLLAKYQMQGDPNTSPWHAMPLGVNYAAVDDAIAINTSQDGQGNPLSKSIPVAT